jgi:hypothetical protein
MKASEKEQGSCRTLPYSRRKIMSSRGKPNILLIIADDLGADVVLITDRSPRRKMYVREDPR